MLGGALGERHRGRVGMFWLPSRSSGSLRFVQNVSRPAGLFRGTHRISISGLVVEYIVAIDVTRARFPADALSSLFPLPQIRGALGVA